MNDDPKTCCFKTILNDLTEEREKLDERKKKFYLVFENANLLVRHFADNPFKLIHFLADCNKRNGKLSLVELINEKKS